eukprot:m.57528 g.57528  ORF g.57528 m.57528 type:complete len:370 (-) comp11604_c0_seq1:129-1238(-)
MSIVVNIGGFNTRCGFSGDMLPEVVFPSREHSGMPDEAAEGPVDTSKPVSKPVVTGTVQDYDRYEEHIRYIYEKKLKMGDTKGSHLLVVDSVSTTDESREKQCEVLFERLQMDRVFMLNDLVASVYSAGRTSSVVFDVGYDCCHAAAVHDGFAFPHTLNRLEVGGEDITEALQMFVQERGISVVRDASEQMKRMHGQAALDFAKASAACHQDLPNTRTFKLPDGTEIDLADEGLRAVESLFRPQLIGKRGQGLSDMLASILETCALEREITPLNNLSQFVLGVGGTSQLPGLAERLHYDLSTTRAHSTLLPSAMAQKPLFVSCLPEQDRWHAAWIGGSIVASLPCFVENNFVSRAEYEEVGATAIHKRC